MQILEINRTMNKNRKLSGALSSQVGSLMLSDLIPLVWAADDFLEAHKPCLTLVEVFLHNPLYNL